MGTVFLGWTPSGEAINVEFDPAVSKLIDVGRCRAIVPKTAVRCIGANWRAAWHPSSQTFYVQRRVRDSAGKPTGTEYLHRQLRGLGKGDVMEVDHKDGHGLNNSDANLQVVSKSEHHRITRRRRPDWDWRTGVSAAWAAKRAASTTGFYGVSKHRKGFAAYVTIAGQPMKYLGKRTEAIEAAKLVNAYLEQFDSNDPRLNKDPKSGEIL